VAARRDGRVDILGCESRATDEVGWESRGANGRGWWWTVGGVAMWELLDGGVSRFPGVRAPPKQTSLTKILAAWPHDHSSSRGELHHDVSKNTSIRENHYLIYFESEVARRS
jgi:hypothetical protein